MTDREQAGRRVLGHRGRRWMTGLHVLVSVLLAGVLVVLVNDLVRRLGPLRVDLSPGGTYSLSPRTQKLVASLDQDVRVVSFFSPSHEMYREIRSLLREFEYESAKHGGRLQVRIVDPNRDMEKTRALKQKYSLAVADVVVFDAGGKVKYVDAREIVHEKKNVDFDKLLRSGQGTYTRTVSFLGEQAFASALLNVTQNERLTVYFLAGHGEGDIADFSDRRGFSTLARTLRRDNLELKPLLLAEHRGVPPDCSAIVVAGPTRKLARSEVDILSGYLDRGGRLCVLLEAGVSTELEGLLEVWGVRLESDVVLDPNATITGRELFVSRFGSHEITRSLMNLSVMLFNPRSVSPLPEHDAAKEVRPDKSRVSTLAMTSKDGWAERDLLQTPAKRDPDTDLPGPVPVAVAVEKGRAGTIDTAIRPTRLVVVGDSDFVSNPALDAAAGGNADFFMSAMNWLLGREALMAVAPKAPDRIEFGVAQSKLRLIFLAVVFLGPALAAGLGLLVWWRRRS